MNHPTLALVVIVIILANLMMAAFALLTSKVTTITIPTFFAFAKSKDAIPVQKNNQDLMQSGRDSVAANIATNVICSSPGPCIVE